MAVRQILLDSIKEYIEINYMEGTDESFEGYGINPYGFENEAKECKSNQLEFRESLPDMDICRNEDQDTKDTVGCKSRMYMGAPMPDLSLVSKRSLNSIVENLDETFSQMLFRLIDERNLKDSYVYKKANVDRRHFSKIRNDINYAPNKKTVIAFALALELTLDEAVDLMKKAGFAFSRSSKFDVIICYFIEHKDFNFIEINEVLFTYGQPILGE